MVTSPCLRRKQHAGRVAASSAPEAAPWLKERAHRSLAVNVKDSMRCPSRVRRSSVIVAMAGNAEDGKFVRMGSAEDTGSFGPNRSVSSTEFRQTQNIPITGPSTSQVTFPTLWTEMVDGALYVVHPLLRAYATRPELILPHDSETHPKHGPVLRRRCETNCGMRLLGRVGTTVL